MEKTEKKTIQKICRTSLAGKSAEKILPVLGGFCLFLSTIEYLIPKPLPFMRLGIANLPLIFAVDILPLKFFFILAAVKVLGQALITGTLFSYVFIFSLAGGFFSAAVMFALRSLLKKRISFIGIGAAGALSSNIVQLLLASVFIFRENTKYIASPFLLAGLITGTALGLFCEYFTKNSVWYSLWYAALKNASHAEKHSQSPETGQKVIE